MRIAQILVAAVAAFAGTTSADCFGSGPTLNKDFANSNLNPTCRQLLGSYGPGQIRSVCLNSPGTAKTLVYFAVKLRGDRPTRVMDMDQCRSGLGKEISGCSKGGRTQYGNWEYT